MREDEKAFYVQKTVCNRGGGGNLWTIDEDGQLTLLGQDLKNYDIAKRIYGLQLSNSDRYPHTFVYSSSSPYKYRLSGGKLYQQDMSSIDWTPVQKIKLGTADIYDGEICNLSLRSAASMQWMTDGNNLSTI